MAAIDADVAAAKKEKCFTNRSYLLTCMGPSGGGFLRDRRGVVLGLRWRFGAVCTAATNAGVPECDVDATEERVN
jgi:hypothetical protein